MGYWQVHACLDPGPLVGRLCVLSVTGGSHYICKYMHKLIPFIDVIRVSKTVRAELK